VASLRHQTWAVGERTQAQNGLKVARAIGATAPVAPVPVSTGQRWVRGRPLRRRGRGLHEPDGWGVQC
jgi:hypothetical protein